MLSAIFLIVLGIVSIMADSGGFALLIFLLGVFWIGYCLPYLIKMNKPYIKIRDGKLQYNHSFESQIIDLNRIKKIQVKIGDRDIGNHQNADVSIDLHTCLIKIYLKNVDQPVVINPTYVGDARDFKKFKRVVSEI